MPRGPRYRSPGWSDEVTTQTICNMFILPATRYFARVFTGILARAQELSLAPSQGGARPGAG